MLKLSYWRRFRRLQTCRSSWRRWRGRPSPWRWSPATPSKMSRQRSRIRKVSRVGVSHQRTITFCDEPGWRAGLLKCLHSRFSFNVNNDWNIGGWKVTLMTFYIVSIQKSFVMSLIGVQTCGLWGWVRFEWRSAFRYPPWSAASDLCWKAAGGWTHAVRLQHPER